MSGKAIVLLSGGLDSTTVLAMAQARSLDVHAITFDYSQRHSVEIAAARRIALRYGVKEHIVVTIDLRTFGGSALTSSIDVPKQRSVEEMLSGVPVTYVPARNTVFLSMALAWAEVIGASDIFIGANALDFAGYPDCRPEYIAAFQAVANLAVGRSVTINAPIINMTKSQIIQRGVELGVDYSMTSSCYAPDAEGVACGECDACLLRRDGFRSLGINDPTTYR